MLDAIKEFQTQQLFDTWAIITLLSQQKVCRARQSKIISCIHYQKLLLRLAQWFEVSTPYLICVLWTTVYGSHIIMKLKMCNMTWSTLKKNDIWLQWVHSQKIVFCLFLEVVFFQLNNHFLYIRWNCSMNWKQSLKRRQQVVANEKEERKLKNCFKIFFLNEKKNLSVNIFYTYDIFCCRRFLFRKKRWMCQNMSQQKNVAFDTH